MKSVYVFGDAILDHDMFVRPVGIVKSESMFAPCVDHDRDEYSLGGAGRVAATLAKNGQLNVALYSCYGGIGLGAEFVRAAAESGVRLGTLSHVTRTVSVKHRIWEGNDTPRLLMRIDDDTRQTWGRVDSAYLCDEELHDAACFVIVNHDKGCVSQEFKETVINYATSLQHIVLVDPGKDDALLGYGSPRTIFKMNAQQAQRLAATKLPTPQVFDWNTLQSEEVYYELAGRVEKALYEIRTAGIWLTLGPGGMLYLRNGMDPIRIKCSNNVHPIVDSCGAGDAAMAQFASSIHDDDLADRERLSQRVSAANDAALAACQTWRWLR